MSNSYVFCVDCLDYNHMCEEYLKNKLVYIANQFCSCSQNYVNTMHTRVHHYCDTCQLPKYNKYKTCYIDKKSNIVETLICNFDNF